MVNRPWDRHFPLESLLRSALMNNTGVWGSEESSIGQEKINCYEIVTKASPNPVRSLGTAIQSWAHLKQDGDNSIQPNLPIISCSGSLGKGCDLVQGGSLQPRSSFGGIWMRAVDMPAAGEWEFQYWRRGSDQYTIAFTTNGKNMTEKFKYSLYKATKLTITFF